MSGRRSRRGRAPLTVIGAVLAAALFWRFPPFHLVPLEGARAQRRMGVFNPGLAAAELWQSKLLPALDRAVDANELLGALARDAAAAGKRYGRISGLGGAALFVVRGSGRVVSVDDDYVVVGLADSSSRIKLPMGPVFGDAVRDAPGMVDISRFPSSQDFNDLSTELNRLVEARVTPELREKAAVGTAVRFAGCIEIEESEKADGLVVIPVRVEWP